MYFLLSRIDGGAESYIGLVVASTPKEAAEKMAMELVGSLTHCWSQMPNWTLKELYHGAPLFLLQELKELDALPEKDKATLKILEPRI